MKKFLFAGLFGLFACDAFAVLCTTVASCPSGQTMSCGPKDGCDNDVCTCVVSSFKECFDSCTVVGDDCTSGGVDGTCALNSEGCKYCDTSANSCDNSEECNTGSLRLPSEVVGNPGLYKLTYSSYCNKPLLGTDGTCVDSQKSWYACGNGYYANGTDADGIPQCEPCPGGAASGYGDSDGKSAVPVQLVWETYNSGTLTLLREILSGAADITDCYIELDPDDLFTDENGDTYSVEAGSKCYYVQSGS